MGFSLDPNQASQVKQLLALQKAMEAAQADTLTGGKVPAEEELGDIAKLLEGAAALAKTGQEPTKEGVIKAFKEDPKFRADASRILEAGTAEDSEAELKKVMAEIAAKPENSNFATASTKGGFKVANRKVADKDISDDLEKAKAIKAAIINQVKTEIEKYLKLREKADYTGLAALAHENILKLDKILSEQGIEPKPENPRYIAALRFADNVSKELRVNEPHELTRDIKEVLNSFHARLPKAVREKYPGLEDEVLAQFDGWVEDRTKNIINSIGDDSIDTAKWDQDITREGTKRYDKFTALLQKHKVADEDLKAVLAYRRKITRTNMLRGFIGTTMRVVSNPALLFKVIFKHGEQHKNEQKEMKGEQIFGLEEPVLGTHVVSFSSFFIPDSGSDGKDDGGDSKPDTPSGGPGGGKEIPTTIEEALKAMAGSESVESKRNDAPKERKELKPSLPTSPAMSASDLADLFTAPDPSGKKDDGAAELLAKLGGKLAEKDTASSGA